MKLRPAPLGALAVPLAACMLLAHTLPTPAQFLPAMSGMQLVDEIDCSKTPPSGGGFREYPEGISSVESILGSKARVLPNDKPGLKYFGYNLGRGKGLKGGEAYVLELEYPEDAPRTLYIINSGSETNRGFHTGPTVGDAMKPRYVNNLPESLDIPLSQKYEKWQTLFHLHDMFPEQLRSRDAEHPRDKTPEDGFWVFVAQMEPEQAPLSKGAAVSHIRLYKAPTVEQYAVKLRTPPADLPQRYIFDREEMGDSVVGKSDKERGLKEPMDWFTYKARLFRFLGMNTFCKDLLEFGANQGWDSDKFGGNSWVYQSHDPQRWDKIIDIATKNGLYVLPYYEYAGSKGQNGHGNKKGAKPLGDQDTYTHIKWAESARADLTDPETYEDLRKILEITIADQKKDGKFVGAWLRPRSSQLPISFAAETVERFNADTKPGTPATRESLRSDKEQYAAYIKWWNGKRLEFFNKLAQYIREASGNPEAVLLYTFDPSEPGRPHPDKEKSGLVAEDPSLFKGTDLKPTSLEQAIKDRRQFEAMTLPPSTWEKWEWQHAIPAVDPESYKNNEGVIPTFTFNRKYTVADPEALDAFRTKSGLGIIRHFSLNENMFQKGDSDPVGADGNKNLFGYFVSDVERAGPYCMLSEVLAVANGDPRFIGYLTSSNFNRGFPQYVRAFNSAFLALPALPSERLEGASGDKEVVVRRIDAGKHGVYYAVANTGYGAKQKVAIKLPDGGTLTNAATGQAIPAANGTVTLDMYPAQLLSLHVAK